MLSLASALSTTRRVGEQVEHEQQQALLERGLLHSSRLLEQCKFDDSSEKWNGACSSLSYLLITRANDITRACPCSCMNVKGERCTHSHPDVAFHKTCD